jgi:hypothetical protein
MRAPVLAILAIVTLAPLPVAAGQDPDALRGGLGFAVQIGWDDDLDAYRVGLDTAVMRTKAELIIRQAGLPIITVAPGDTLPDALFQVYASALQLETDDAEPEKLKTFAYLVTAEYAEYLPVRGQMLFGDLWSCSRYGVAEQADFIYTSITQCVEQFANQWLEANPPE